MLQPGGDAQRGVPLFAQGLNRRFVHSHDLRGMNHAEVSGNLLFFLQLLPDPGLFADQDDFQIRPEMGGLNPSANRIPGSMVAPHGVNADAHPGQASLRFFDDDHLLLSVVSAIGADPVGRLGLMAMAAGGDCRRMDLPVCAPFVGARVRMPTFGDRHLPSPS